MMAKITGYKDVLIADLVVGSGQSRLTDTGGEIEELAENIRLHGLLQPILIAPAESEGKYEIILGQRRYLAHKMYLKEKSIRAGILDEKVDKLEAKIISLSENVARKALSTNDKIDVFTSLYKQYGSIKAVVEKSGFSRDIVTMYIKYDRLSPALKKMFDEGEIKLKDALDANDAVWDEEKDADKKRVDLAKSFKEMGGQQKIRTAQILKTTPKISVEKAIEESQKQIVHTITITQGPRLHEALKNYANKMGQRMEDAAAELLEEALDSGGFLESDED